MLWNARDSDTLRTRALIYGAFSDLLASPFDDAAAVNYRVLAGRLATAAAFLPFPFNADEVAAAAGPELADPALVRRHYSSLFEVGGDGPPVPLRADLVRNNETISKEEVIRFYDHFGFNLAPQYQWAPDHLSIMLEFIKVLTLRETSAADGEQVVTMAVGARDFTARHLATWLPLATARLAKIENRGGFFGCVLKATAAFITLDLAWQAETAGQLEGY